MHIHDEINHWFIKATNNLVENSMISFMILTETETLNIFKINRFVIFCFRFSLQNQMFISLNVVKNASW